MNTTQNGAPPPLEEVRASRQRLERMTWLLDEAIRIPGLGWRIGAESIIGLVPVIGDVLGLAASGFVVWEGVKIGAPRPLLLKMTGFAAFDAVVGLVPLLGDVFDFAFKANRINARLLGEYLEEQERRHGIVVAGKGQRRAGLALMAAGFAAVVAVIWWLVRGF